MPDRPMHLYKYRSIDDNNREWTESIFRENKVYFSSADQFNDPFDCKHGYSFAGTEREQRNYLRELTRHSHPDWSRAEIRRVSRKYDLRVAKKPGFEKELENIAGRIISGLGICCLTEVPNDLLMWSHYANAHKGYCIQFLNDNNEFFMKNTRKVVYSEEFPIVNLQDTGEEHVRKALYTKAKQWEYEQEWRSFDQETGPGLKTISEHLITGVIFGCRMTKEHKIFVRELCNGRTNTVKFSEGRECERKYGLDIVDL